MKNRKTVLATVLALMLAFTSALSLPVFRHRAGLRHPGDRLQPCYEPGAGHQYRRQ